MSVINRANPSFKIILCHSNNYIGLKYEQHNCIYVCNGELLIRITIHYHIY